MYSFICVARSNSVKSITTIGTLDCVTSTASAGGDCGIVGSADFCPSMSLECLHLKCVAERALLVSGKLRPDMSGFTNAFAVDFAFEGVQFNNRTSNQQYN